MIVSFFSFLGRAVKRLPGHAIALIERNENPKRAIIARYSMHRWCDSTERALNEELMGKGGWWVDRGVHNDFR